MEAVEIADVWNGSLPLNATSAISLDDCRDTLLADLQLVVEVASYSLSQPLAKDTIPIKQTAISPDVYRDTLPADLQLVVEVVSNMK